MSKKGESSNKICKSNSNQLNQIKCINTCLHELDTFDDKYEKANSSESDISYDKYSNIEYTKSLQISLKESINQNDILNEEINKVINENKILKEEIEINSQNNKMKELNDCNFKDINSEEMKQQINELKVNNNQLIRKLKDVNDGNYQLEQKNNVLENEMGKLKGYEQMLEQLKEKYDNLSFDYQRIQRENSSLKNLINNNQ